MNKSNIHTRRTSALPGLIAAACALAITACATVPMPPTAAMDAAAAAIANAEQARAAEYAALELSTARDELAAARTAAQQEHMVLAGRRAEEARAIAELASARADAAKAKVVNDELQASIEVLRQEMQRNPGAR